MTRTSDDQLFETLAMVEEARDYLATMPPVPATLQFVHKLSRFLEAYRSQHLPWQELPWRGTAHDPAGRPLLDAMLLDTRLMLRKPRVDYQVKLTPEDLQNNLAQGISLTLARPALFQSKDTE